MPIWGSFAASTWGPAHIEYCDPSPVFTLLPVSFQRMPPDANEGGSTTLSPDAAFAALGNETRMEILQTLGDADGQLTFSELYDRSDVRDSGQFSYHLDKLVGHFVRKTDDGYELQQAGLRVVEAVLSGAITETPILEPTDIDAPCPYCGGAIEVSYREERLLQRCTECAGAVGGGALPEGTLERGYLPPAGLEDRTPREVVGARNTWSMIERVAMANGVCPRCAGIVEHSVQVCDDHASKGICERCDGRHAVRVDARCLNCPHEKAELILFLLFGDPAFRAFFDRRGVDVFSLAPEEGERLVGYDEEVVSTDPFEARFTFTFGDDTITLTVDDGLSVVDVTERTTTDSG